MMFILSLIKDEYGYDITCEEFFDHLYLSMTWITFIVL
jgi:hypothetical protein